MVDVLLNKRVKARLLLDTGAGLVVVSKETAKKLGFNLDSEDVIEVGLADGSKVGAVVILDYVSVQGVQLENDEAAVILSEAASQQGRDGLLGMSFLGLISALMQIIAS